MAEWSIAAVLKTVVLQGTGGSNPSLSAKARHSSLLLRRAFFYTSFVLNFVRVTHNFSFIHKSCYFYGIFLFLNI